MKLSLLLKLQVVYMLLGIGYNCVSLLMATIGSKPLSSTSATLGIATLLIYGLFLLPGFWGYHKAYRLLMAIAVIVFGYGGVISHLMNYSNLGLYYSTAAWLLAIAINLSGVYLNVVAATGKFESNSSLHS
jgi:hypothetical protein